MRWPVCGMLAAMRAARGFHVVEAVVIVAVCAMLAALVIVLVGGNRDSERRVRDAGQLGQIHQAMLSWANTNGDRFPLPSLIDVADKTVAAKDAKKNTTANIFSVLVFHDMLLPEMLISPAETNERVVVDADYDFTKVPAGSVAASTADPLDFPLWDPSFKAGLGEEGGNVSYAHLLPSGDRLSMWSNTFSSQQVVLGNRGPRVRGVEYERSQAADAVASVQLADAQSNTLRFYSPYGQWSGHVVYNDNHVRFMRSMVSRGEDGQRSERSIGFVRAGDAGRLVRVEDVLFYDEPADAQDGRVANVFLSIFVEAGERPSDFEAVWD